MNLQNQTRDSAMPARMVRIKKITNVIRLLINGTFLLSLFFGGYFLLGLVGVFDHPRGITVTFSALQTYSAPFDIPTLVLLLAFMQFGLLCGGVIALNHLMSYFEEGRFFTNNTARCIQRVGYLVIADWVVRKVLDALARGMELDLSRLAVGLLIILLAWIIDEARKLQEEQALTV